ncbi:MAG TPA: Cof-type HAD-IIB family hydrolase [Herpetosiphonaceae bacterium]|nr:Cof-type HAD-IIB family hydrolase [Herpetosiphonaceae bacterium]
MIKLLATDLDGTLLRRDGTISDRTCRALEAARDAGMMTVLVTARPPRTVRARAHAVGIGGPAICCNGANVYDLDQDHMTGHTPLTPHVARGLVLALREAIPGVRFAVELGVRSGWEPGFATLRPVVREQAAGVEDDALVLCSEPVTKLIACHSDLPADELLRIAQTLVGETAHVTHSGAPYVEISAAGVKKAWALAALCTQLAVPPSEVVAFGEMPNDVPMLVWAGRGVAVANAHPEVLRAADEVTDSNEEDGVAVVIEQLLQGKRSSTAASLIPPAVCPE